MDGDRKKAKKMPLPVRVRSDASDALEMCLALKPGKWFEIGGKSAKTIRNAWGMWSGGKHASHFAKLSQWPSGADRRVVYYGPKPEPAYVKSATLRVGVGVPPPTQRKATRSQHAVLFDWMRNAQMGDWCTYGNSANGVNYTAGLALQYKRKLPGKDFSTRVRAEDGEVIVICTSSPVPDSKRLGGKN